MEPLTRRELEQIERNERQRRIQRRLEPAPPLARAQSATQSFARRLRRLDARWWWIAAFVAVLAVFALLRRP